MSVAENRVEFKSLEEKVFSYVCKCGVEIIKKILESYDEEIRESRDKKEYRSKGKRKRTIKMVMGEVEFERNVYEKGEKKYEYLLDKELGLSRSGFFGDLMSELIAKRRCESLYRNAAQAVSEQTGQVLSHTAAWNVVQVLGEEIDKQEIHNAELSKAHKGIGVLESNQEHC